MATALSPARSVRVGGRTITVTPFRSPGTAFDDADHAARPSMVVMGDCPWFWVVTVGDAQRLVNAGYELAPRD